MDTQYASYSLNHKNNSKIENKIYLHNNIHYTIKSYDPKYICNDACENLTLYRSVIFSHPENTLLSFSPQKSVLKEDFCNKYEINDDDIYINEYIDGTMIHLFYDYRVNQWEIATKNSIGGNYKLMNSRLKQKTIKTVREMFIDAFTRDRLSETNNVYNNPIINGFPKNNSYTFVFLHPDNPIAHPITQPYLYLTNVFDITSNIHRVVSIPPHIFEDWVEFKDTCILFPKTKSFPSWDTLEPNKIIHFDSDHGVNCGYVATHLPSGERCKFYNAKYLEKLRIKTISSPLLFHYLCLRRSNMLNEFLQRFPHSKKYFRIFKTHFSEFIENIHSAYLMKYVWKNGVQIEERFDKYIIQIHRDIYIPNIRSKMRITKKTVFDFLIQKHPTELLYDLFSENRSTKIIV